MSPLEPSCLQEISRWLSDLDDLSLFDRESRMPIGPDMLRSGLVSADEKGVPDKHWFSIKHRDKKLVGMIGLEKLSLVNRDGVVPMFVSKPFRGRGIGIRSLALLMDVAFRQFGLQRLTSYLRADNEASRALTERAGFRQEGRLRQAWFSDGRHHDMLVIGILRQEWLERRAALADELDPRTVVTFGGDISGEWSWPRVRDRAEVADAARA
jgi:RimJ/RimL family protein N-acetyltransferase